MRVLFGNSFCVMVLLICDFLNHLQDFEVIRFKRTDFSNSIGYDDVEHGPFHNIQTKWR